MVYVFIQVMSRFHYDCLLLYRLGMADAVRDDSSIMLSIPESPPTANPGNHSPTSPQPGDADYHGGQPPFDSMSQDFVETQLSAASSLDLSETQLTAASSIVFDHPVVHPPGSQRALFLDDCARSPTLAECDSQASTVVLFSDNSGESQSSTYVQAGASQEETQLAAASLQSLRHSPRGRTPRRIGPPRTLHWGSHIPVSDEQGMYTTPGVVVLTTAAYNKLLHSQSSSNSGGSVVEVAGDEGQGEEKQEQKAEVDVGNRPYPETTLCDDPLVEEPPVGAN